MPNIPFEKQLFPITVEQIEHQIALGKAVSGDELHHAIERSTGHQLDWRLRMIISKFFVPPQKRRGRPPNGRAREDFALEQLDEDYAVLLRQFQDAARNDSVPNDQSPSECAYRKLATDMKDHFSHVDGRALANKHSIWKKRSIPTDDQLDSEDFEAEIDRLFPASPKS
jgi:hypothetical protein